MYIHNIFKIYIYLRRIYDTLHYNTLHKFRNQKCSFCCCWLRRHNRNSNTEKNKVERNTTLENKSMSSNCELN